MSSSQTNFKATMKTIQEDDDYFHDERTKGGQSMLSKNNSNLENDMNHINRSNILEDSIAEPGRNPVRVDGLTDFLTEEYYKKFGIYTTDAGELQKFWRTNVSAAYKDWRMAKTQAKHTGGYGEGLDDLGLGLDAGFAGFSDLGPAKGMLSAGKPPQAAGHRAGAKSGYS